MSTFGSAFRVTTFGESHCRAVGVIVDGCPPGLLLGEADVQTQLDRRRPGQSNLTTPRNEQDAVSILSGTEFGKTLGTPIALTVQNRDQRPGDYGEMSTFPRPSHADYTYMQKYQVRASSGGGRSSARETIGRVAAGAIAEKVLAAAHGVEIVAFVDAVGPLRLSSRLGLDRAECLGDAAAAREAWSKWWALLRTVDRPAVDATAVRCPDVALAAEMQELILETAAARDSIGGSVVCVLRNVPAGLGEPCFDKLEALLAHAMLSIPASKGFELGSGFFGATMRGSVHNDAFTADGDGAKLRTVTNFSGGVQGGISNGEDIYFRVAFKPPATIGLAQETADFSGAHGILEARGRHDPCVVPRAVPIVEAMASLVLLDTLCAQAGRASVADRVRGTF